MKKNWWKEFEDQHQIQLQLRVLKELLFTNEQKRVFQVFDSCVFTKDFLMELFSAEGQLKNVFESCSILELYQWGEFTYSYKTKELWKNIDLYIRYCNPTEEFKKVFSKKMKIVQFVEAYLMINRISNKKGVGLGMRKRLGFYKRGLR